MARHHGLVCAEGTASGAGAGRHGLTLKQLKRRERGCTTAIFNSSDSIQTGKVPTELPKSKKPGQLPKKRKVEILLKKCGFLPGTIYYYVPPIWHPGKNYKVDKS
jgi:hypothetical protein